MKINRRSLLQMIGLGAAAAAFAPAVSEDDQIRALVADVQAHPEKHPEIMAKVREYTGGLITRDTSNGVIAHFGYGSPFRRIAPGEFVDPAEVQQLVDILIGTVPGGEIRFTDNEVIDQMEFAYAQGRADGYNRGREVESASWEARQAIMAQIDESMGQSLDRAWRGEG